MPFRLLVTGPAALFPRPEFRDDLVTYDIMTPLAGRGLLEAIHQATAIRWSVDAITVLNPIRTERRDDGGRRILALHDVAYLIDARFDMTHKNHRGETAGQHAAMFSRRIRQGRYRRQPYLGRPEYPAIVTLLDDDAVSSARWATGSADLGWMLHDVEERGAMRFFRATMDHGVVTVPPRGDPSLMG